MKGQVIIIEYGYVYLKRNKSVVYAQHIIGRTCIYIYIQLQNH